MGGASSELGSAASVRLVPDAAMQMGGALIASGAAAWIVHSVGSTVYTLGTSQTFTLGKVGAAAWGSSSTSEPTIIAKTDNILLDANAARNGNYELDGNGDGVPDQWQMWIWSDGPVYRSNIRAKYGTWSVRIADTDATKDYGLQTVRMTASPDKSYVASTWVYVESGAFNLYLEFWDAMANGNRLSYAYKSTTATGQWEYLDLTMIAPAGTVAIDVLVYSYTGNVGTAYFDGAELRLRRSLWAINLHDGDTGGGVPGWKIAFDRATDLGASHIRTDFVWREFEPFDDQWSPQEIADWRNAVRVGEVRGGDFIAIINGPAPSFVNDANRLAEFSEFCSKIATEFGADIYFYQILNEFNWAFARQLPGDTDSLPAYATYCFNGLLAGEGVTGVNHKSAFKSIVNVYANGGDPIDTTLRSWLDSAGSAIDIVAIDHYPATYEGNCGDWAKLDNLFSIAREPQYMKETALMETGYSSYYWLGHSEYDQENWMNCALPQVRSRGRTHNLNYPVSFFVLANLYELVDENTYVWCAIPQLCHFGLLRTGDLTEKPAYDDFRAQVSTYGW